jgi:hypothetical protein
MIITKKWLDEQDACVEGKDWVAENSPETDGVELVKKLMAAHLDWANWLIVRIMTRPQYLAYAIFAAEQVIEIYEKQYPNDKRPRNAIKAAKKVLAKDTPSNRAAARDAWAAAGDAAGAAAKAARAAAKAARDASGAAWTAAGAAGDAAWAAAKAAGAARDAMQTKILNYGLSLLEAINAK